VSIYKTLATTRRVVHQLKHDHRTLAIALVVPCVLVVLMKYLFDKQPHVFNSVAPIILAIFPMIIMFLITSIAMLRERTSGTLDRLMTQPMSKLDLIFGYALAFCGLAFVQASAVSLVALGLLDVVVAGGTLPVLLTAVLAAFLGMSLGLLVSATATTEFQAVQLVMPIVMPQILLCGLFVPRDQMATALQWLSDVFPITYSVEAMREASRNPDWSSDLTSNLLVVAGFGVAALIIGSITIRRQEKT
jgi:ABC-2 type transport system permease protein